MLNQTQLDNLIAANAADADVVTAASVPTLTPRTGLITYTSAGATLGGIKAATLRATLLSSQVQGSPLGPVAAYADVLLSGPGFDASNADVQALAAQFVAAGILSQADADVLLNVITYPCGDIPTLEEVAARRAVRAAETLAAQQAADRAVACDAVAQAVTGATQTWMNDLLNPARSNLANPVPTVGQLVALLQAVIDGGVA